MNYTGDDNVGKRTSEESGEPGVVGSVIAPEVPDASETSDPNSQDFRHDDELGAAAGQASGGLVPEGAHDAQP